MSDVMEAENPRAVIGGNSTPFDLIEAHISDLMDEARNWLDGSGVNTEADAKNVSILLDEARKAKKEADEKRASEKKPHDDAAKAVQERWKPVLTRCDLIAETAKKALTPYLDKLEAAKREAARIARDEADAAERAAQAAFGASSPSDIDMRIEAESLAASAKSANATANRAEKDRAHAKGGSRAVTLRTSYRAEVTDAQAFARWAWINCRQEVDQFFAGLAHSKFSRSGVTAPPGITIHEKREAV